MLYTLGRSLSQNASRRELFSIPAGFSWNPLFNIYHSGFGYKTTINDAAFIGTASNIYYVDPDANGSADGSSFTNAFTRVNDALDQAISNAEPVRIYLQPGFYNEDDLGWLVTHPGLTHDIALICSSGRAIFSVNETHSWTKTSGQTNVYEAIVGLPEIVIDRTDMDGDLLPLPLEEQISVANVDSNPGSWFYDAGKLYVHTYDTRAADENVFGFRSVDARHNFLLEVNVNVYCYNIDFWGGSGAGVQANASSQHVVYENCTFCYMSGNGFTGHDFDRISLLNCKAKYNTIDGYAYSASSQGTKILEYNCIGSDNGLTGAGTIINGSSAHSGSTIIRIGGTYDSNEGANIADTGSGTQSLNLRCKADNSLTSDQGGLSDCGFSVTGGAEMWLKNCASTSSYYKRRNGSSTLIDLGGFSGDGLDSGTIS
jgi:hypothetical protein